MYSWYRRELVDERLRLIWEEQTALGGCNNGIIATELKAKLKPIDNPPIGWIIPIADKWNKENYSFIIDIKPSTNEVFLCELDEVYGYSFEGWSAIMLRLKVLYNEIGLEELDKQNFIYPPESETIYTMLYLYGSIQNGEIIGTWRPPHGTITALLFWPAAMTFFFEQVKLKDPYFLTSEVRLLSSLNDSWNT